MKPIIKYRINFYYPDKKTIDDYEDVEGNEKQAKNKLDRYKREYEYPSIKLFKAVTTFEEIK